MTGDVLVLVFYIFKISQLSPADTTSNIPCSVSALTERLRIAA
jgi:hypothetical protein